MKNYLTTIKMVLIVGLLSFIVIDLRADKISSADFNTVQEAVYKAAGLSESMQQAENRMVKRFYGLNPQDYEGVVLYAPLDNMDAHELLLVKLSSVSQSEAVEEAIQSRLATQKNSFEGYGAEQTKLLNNCVVKVQGNYILFVVGENAAQTEQAFLNSL